MFNTFEARCSAEARPRTAHRPSNPDTEAPGRFTSLHLRWRGPTSAQGDLDMFSCSSNIKSNIYTYMIIYKYCLFCLFFGFFCSCKPHRLPRSLMLFVKSQLNTSHVQVTSDSVFLYVYNIFAPTKRCQQFWGEPPALSAALPKSSSEPTFTEISWETANKCNRRFI